MSASIRVLFVLVAVTGTLSQTQARGLSPLRPDFLPAETILTLHSAHRLNEIFGAKNTTPSAMDARQSWSSVNWGKVPSMTADDLALRFAQIRDEKILTDGQARARRLTWLYPDDGCYARAEMAVNRLESLGSPVIPVKIFAFGNLTVKTNNTPSGWVSWWYHVAPIVKVDAEYYVIDPAIEPNAPLRVQDWYTRMGGGQIQLSICNSHTYDPEGSCENASQSQQDQANSDERYFLGLEWDRVLSLGRDPNKELGDEPPWRQENVSRP
jgi:hypothetical protein